MNSAKDIIIKPISSQDANEICRRIHYSGKVVPNSQLHLGVFLNGRCEGVMQFGPSMDKKKVITLVRDTKWNGFIELNRMAFSDVLPKNSESRAIAIAIKLIKKNYPHIEWIISFADATQCGDGTIYRASGFVLSGIKKNTSIIKLSSGEIACTLTYNAHHATKQNGKSGKPVGSTFLEGFQLRYIYFINKDAQKRLTVPIIPFSKIAELGASMYKGKKRATSIEDDASGYQPEEGS